MREVLRVALVLPFVALPAIVPGVAAAFRTRPLEGFAEPKLSLPSLTDSLFALLAVFAGIWTFDVLVIGIVAVPAASKTAILVAGIVAVLALARVSLPASAALLARFRAGGFALEDALRLSRAPGSPAPAVVSAFLVPALLFASFSSLAFHFASELGRFSTSGYDVFALNLSESDVAKIRAAYPVSESYSLIRARISAINGQPLSDRFSGNAPREFSREFNLTSSPLPDRVLEGEKRAPKIGETSMDDEFARNLGVSVGDVVTFAVMGREFPLKVTAIRESVREGIRPFFYFQVAPGEFAGLPPSYFLAASPPDARKFRSDAYAAAGSKVSFVDVRQTVATVRSVAERILPAVWAFLAAIGILAVTVAVAVLSSLRTFRKSRDRTYRAVGADSGFLMRHSRFSILHYSASAFLAASVAAFPTVWWSIASVSFLKFSPSAAAWAVTVLFAFLAAASAAVWVAEG